MTAEEVRARVAQELDRALAERHVASVARLCADEAALRPMLITFVANAVLEHGGTEDVSSGHD